MKKLTCFKTIGALSASVILFGCPSSDEHQPELDADMHTVQHDMGADQHGGEDEGVNKDDGVAHPDMEPDAEHTDTDLERAQARRERQISTAYCALLFECPETYPNLLLTTSKFPDQRACIEGYSAAYALTRDEERTHVNQGRRRVDEAQVAACLASPELTSASVCAQGVDALDTLHNESPCANLYVGAVEQGGDCLFNADCSGAFRLCSHEIDPSLAACRGVCTSFGDPGDACALDQDCKEGTYCGDFDPTVQAGVCKLRAATGEPCSASSDCMQGLSCQGEEDARSCRTSLVIGQACNRHDECGDEGMLCKFDEASGMSACAPRPGLNEACTFSFYCEVGLYCELPLNEDGTFADGVCLSEDNLSASFTLVMNQGEACGEFGNEFRMCRAGLACLGFEIDSEDGQGLGGTCEAPLTQGQACTFQGDCAAPLKCSEAGICSPSVNYADGQSCHFGEECSSGYCQVNEAAIGLLGQCMPYPACVISP